MDDFSQSQFVFGSWCGSGEPCALWWCPRRWLDLRPPSFPGFFKTSPRFLVSSKPRLVSWFLQTSPAFLVSSKSCPFSWFLSIKPRPTMVVVTRRFSPDLSVCSSTIDRCDFVLFFHHTLGRVSKRAQPHADAISSLSLSLSRSHIADFAFIIMALFTQFYSPCIHRSFFVCPGGGSVG